MCQLGGELVCCDDCPRIYHLACLQLASVPGDRWRCPLCVAGSHQAALWPPWAPLSQPQPQPQLHHHHPAAAAAAPAAAVSEHVAQATSSAPPTQHHHRHRHHRRSTPLGSPGECAQPPLQLLPLPPQGAAGGSWHDDGLQLRSQLPTSERDTDASPAGVSSSAAAAIGAASSASSSSAAGCAASSSSFAFSSAPLAMHACAPSRSGGGSGGGGGGGGSGGALSTWQPRHAPFGSRTLAGARRHVTAAACGPLLSSEELGVSLHALLPQQARAAAPPLLLLGGRLAPPFSSSSSLAPPSAGLCNDDYGPSTESSVAGLPPLPGLGPPCPDVSLTPAAAAAASPQPQPQPLPGSSLASSALPTPALSAPAPLPSMPPPPPSAQSAVQQLLHRV